MNTIEDNRFTRAWSDLGALMQRPSAILCVSAHWYTDAILVTGSRAPRTIHDFYGFPAELYEFEYPAPGSPDLAATVIDLVGEDLADLDRDSWGLDHGTTSVLAHMFPAADVPVVQLSIDATRPIGFHLELGRRLAPLRDEGVLILGSGNVVHDLRSMAWDRPDAGFDWAERFEGAVSDVMHDDATDVLDLVGHPDFHRAAPTPDHFIPLLFVAGAAEPSRERFRTLVDGCSYGSISMAAFVTDTDSGPNPGESSASRIVEGLDEIGEVESEPT